MAIKLPTGLKAGDELAYLARMKEKLRLKHNEQGAKCRSGEITDADFKLWQKTIYRPAVEEVNVAIHPYNRTLMDEKLVLHGCTKQEASALASDDLEALKVATKHDSKIDIEKMV